MCQAYDIERRAMISHEHRLSIEGFNAARLGEDPTPNTDEILYEFERKAWIHGYNCFSEKLLPWAIESQYHIANNMEEGIRIRKEFKESGELPKELLDKLNSLQ